MTCRGARRGPRRVLPRKGVPAGRPGIERTPARLWRTEERYCPIAAKWVGVGSKFANPFAGEEFPAREVRLFARVYEGPRALLDAAALLIRVDRSERWDPVNKTHMRPRPDERERFAAAAWLFREWRAGRLADLPRGIKRGVDEILAAGEFGPPSDETIRAELRGFDLASEIPYAMPAHVDELLRVANEAAPDMFEEKTT